MTAAKSALYDLQAFERCQSRLYAMTDEQQTVRCHSDRAGYRTQNDPCNGRHDTAGDKRKV